VITGHTADGGNELTDNYAALAKCGGTLVFLMGLSNLSQIIDRLKKEGMSDDTPIAVVERGTTVAQRCVRGTFLDIEEQVKTQELLSPVVIIIGAVAELNFINPAKKIGITGTAHFTRKLEAEIEKSGKKIYRFPYVQMQETEITQKKEILQDIAQYTWILFTSANGVRYFFSALREFAIDQRKIGGVRFAVIGSGTAEVLAEYGYQADFIPTSFYAGTFGREFAAMLMAQGTQNTQKLLIPRTLHGSKKLTEALDVAGISYVELPVYETVANRELTEQAIAAIPYLDCMTFASASGVRFLCEAMNESQFAEFAKLRILCIGKETAAELEKYGIKKYEIAETATARGLADMM
jgi:uroporphyrinogen III methyltransferase/synthase